MYPFNFQQCLQFLDQKGKELFGPKFKIYIEDHPLIYKHCVYGLKHQAEADRLGIDLRKGILLTGPIGCGKTQLMTLMRYGFPPEQGFVVRSCSQISHQFGAEGYPVITMYTSESFRRDGLPRTYCFDDLGTEQPVSYFGNECEVMGEIILNRYDYFISAGMITHMTTNLNADEIGDRYGNRSRSRMREMMNLFSFDAGTKDRRV